MAWTHNLTHLESPNRLQLPSLSRAKLAIALSALNVTCVQKMKQVLQVSLNHLMYIRDPISPRRYSYNEPEEH